MTKCSLCGVEIEDTFHEEYIDELNGRGLDYCRTCREVLKLQFGKDTNDKKKINKVKIKTSDHYLPGFKFSKEKNCFVREKNSKQ